MSGSYNASRFIVGFRDWYTLDDYRNHNFSSPEEMARAALSKVIGFVSVIKRFDFLNAVLASVDPAQSDQFAFRVTALDEVEYKDHDYYFGICSFTNSLNLAHRKGVTQNEGLAPHRSRYHKKTPAFGASIALIDTGLSPHPFLPALSFQQAVEMPLTRHPSVHSVSVENLLGELRLTEGLFPDAYRDALDHHQLASMATAEVARFFDSEWRNWDRQLQTWIRQTHPAPAPTIPRSRSIFGAFRIVSPQSWNFVDDSPNILDYDGHGTGIAGCISALPPLSQGVLPEISPVLNTSSILTRSLFRVQCVEHLDYDVSGLAPYSELIILKCLDSRKADNSTLSTVVTALGRCLKIRPDCIYFGLALKNLLQTPLMSLSRLTAQIDAAGITMFAPAGNDGMAGLRAPAALPGVLSITAVEWDSARNNYKRARYSSYADVANQEYVEFCACGGTEQMPIQLLSTEFGFTYDCGTSISAAVVAAVFLSELSAMYRSATEDFFRNQAGVRSQVVPSTVKSAVESWSPSSNDIDSIKNAMRAKAISPPAPHASNVAHPEFGYGLPCI